MTKLELLKEICSTYDRIDVQRENILDTEIKAFCCKNAANVEELKLFIDLLDVYKNYISQNLIFSMTEILSAHAGLYKDIDFSDAEARELALHHIIEDNEKFL